MLDGFEVMCHSSIRISKEKIIYIDPYMITNSYNDADYIFITHDHYDHFSEEDIEKVRKGNTVIIVPESLYNKCLEINFQDKNIITVTPNKKYKINELEFETIPAYNINKPFHPKDNMWVGYVLTINKIRYYIAGDTDITEENKLVKCDAAFVPIGSKYTMDYKEAATLINHIKPKIAVPIHYGLIVGSNEDANNFISMLNNDINGKILIKP